MALKLDNNLLEELGLGALPEHEKQLLLRQIYEKLEMNVGVRLADQMSNEQLDEFEKFVDANDDKGAFHWLETNFPNYKDVVNEEFEKLKAEIKQYAPQMLAVAQHNAAQAAAAPGQQGMAAGDPAPGAAAGSGQYTQPGQYGAPAGPAAMPQQEYPSYPPQGSQQPGQYGQPQPSQQNPYNQPYPGNQQPQYPNYPPGQPPAGPAQQ